MSIMNMPIYRQTGGNILHRPAAEDRPTAPSIAAPFIGGVAGPSLPNLDTSSLDSTYKSAIDWANNPQNIPQYYTDPTVAQFDPLQQQAQQGKLDAAGQFDDLTQQTIGDYQSQLDPNSELNQRISNQASQGASNAFYGAGTPGSARGQYAANAASQDAVRANRQNALTGLGNERANLTGAADIVGGVGDDRQGLSQNIINEDIKRFNYGQLSPQQQVDRVLGLSSQQEALKAGNVGYDVGTAGSGGGSDIFSNLLGAFGGGGSGGGLGGILGGLFNEGGAVYKNDGGMMPEAPMMDQGMPQDPMMDQGMPMEPMMPQGAPMEPQGGIMGGGESMSMDMMSSAPMSEMDKAEGILSALAAASGGSLTIKRKTKGGKK